MANLLGGFFKRIEKPQDTHPPSALNEFSQYDSEYITYCIEQDQTLSNLETEIKSCDDPKETVMQTLRTACAFYAADWTGIIQELNQRFLLPRHFYQVSLQSGSEGFCPYYYTSTPYATEIVERCQKRSKPLENQGF